MRQSKMEKISGTTKPGKQCSSRVSKSKRFSALTLSILFTFSQLHSVALAQVVVAPNAPSQNQPGMGAPAGSNQVPVVNIVTPNAAGVSHNIYNQFNVQQNGLILNNSTWNTQTQLGGWIQGNPNHPYGNARLIINEVNGSNPSMLNGYIEIAGKKADIIIANPAGISIDGAGFINASGVTLTTGNIQYNTWGNVEAYRVGTGKITISGAGLDTRATDYTNIIARAVEVNSGIWANDLRVTAGTGLVSPDAQPISVTVADASGQPLFAIDVASLGGMYAGKIRLIGTETGVGVRNAGNIGASAGQVQINADGKLINSGNINSSDNTGKGSAGIQIATTGDIQNLGNIYSQGNANLQTHQTLQNQGTLAAGGNLNIQAQTVANQNNAQSTGLIAAGMNSDGSLNNNGNLNIQAVQVTNDGQLLAGKDLELKTQTLSNQNTIYAGQNATLTAQIIDNNSSTSKLSAAANVTLQANSINNQTGVITAQNIALQGQTAGSSTSLNNQGGIIASTQNINAKATSLNNTSGKLHAGGDISLALSGNYTNQQTSEIIANNSLNLELTGDLINQGKLLAGQKTSINAAAIDNTVTGEIAANSTEINAVTLTNRGLIDGGTTVVKGQNVTNLGTGRIYGNHLSIQAQTLTNKDEAGTAAIVAARQRMDLGVGRFYNQNGAIIYSVGDMHIGGSLDAENKATGSATLVQNDGATIESGGNMIINADQVNNTNPTFATEREITYTGHVTTILYGGREYDIGEVFILRDARNVDPILDRLLTGNLQNTASSLAGLKDQLGVLDGRYIILPSSNGKFPSDKFGPANGLTSIPKLAYTPAQTITQGDPSEGGSTTFVPEAFNYDANSRIWEIFGVEAPTGSRPQHPGFTCEAYCTPSKQQQYDAYITAEDAWRQANMPRYTALNELITEYHADIRSRAITDFDVRDYDVNHHRDVVVASRPGQILSGGNMTINITNPAGNLTNDKSQIMAGGNLAVNGNVNNIDAKGQVFDSYGNAKEERTWMQSHRWDPDDRRWNSKTFSLTTPPRQESLFFNAVPQGNATIAGSGTQVGNLSGGSVTIGSLNINLPTNSFYSIHPGAGKNYLIETDPRFASYGSWLTSDHIFKALGIDASIHKRLGDGFYEQQLVREQVGKLTGYRFLAGYQSDEEQYKALMNAGVEFAAEHQLQVGIALTAEQMKHLTNDIIWLVSQEVTLPNGTKETVLVPQLYSRGGNSMITTGGTLMSGNNVIIQGENGKQITLNNNATIAAREVLLADVSNLQNNLGQLHGNNVFLKSATDITNLGGIISADNSLTMVAERDINISSTVSQGYDSTGHITGIGNAGVVYLSGQGNATVGATNNGQIQIQAGRDVNLTGAHIVNDATSQQLAAKTRADDDQGLIENSSDGRSNDDTATQFTTPSTNIVAGNNVNLGTVLVSNSHNINYDSKNWRRENSSSEVGSTISTQGNINLVAENNVGIRAATLESDQGNINVAGNTVTVEAGAASHQLSTGHYVKTSGLLSSGSITTKNNKTDNMLVGSSLSGENINLQSKQDLNIKASDVVATQNVNLVSEKGNIHITSGTETSEVYNYHRVKESGFLSGGAVISIGTTQTTTTDTQSSAYAKGSTIGSLEGNINISAKEGSYNQTGSNVLALEGDINAVAQDINIKEARESSRSEKTFEFKQTALSIGVSSPVTSVLETAMKISEATERTKNSRMQALAIATAGLNLYNSRGEIQHSAEQLSQGNYFGKTETVNPGVGGKVGKQQTTPGGMGISISLGSSKSKSQSVQESSTAKGSNMTAGGNINLVATGNGNKESGNITIQGSTVSAGNNATLIANDKINILAAANTSTSKSSSKSSSGSIGVTLGAGWSVNAGVSGSKGKGHGNGTEWSESYVKSGNTTTLVSGGDTNIIGSQVIGNKVVADVGGDLTIQSLQDTSHEESSNKGFGASVNIGPSMNMGLSVNASKASAKGNHQSVNEYAGIMAGDGGFDINVKGHTSLIGAIIASTDEAALSGKNTLTTGSLSTENLYNHSEYESKGSSSGIGMGIGGGALSFSPSMPVKGKTSDRDSSITTSGVSNAVITITNEEEQKRRTGKTGEETIASIDTSVRTGQSAGGLTKDWNTQELVSEMQTNLEIAKEFNQAAGNLVTSKVKEAEALREQAKYENDPAKKAGMLKRADELENFWGMGGNGRLAVTAITAAIGGNVSGSTAEMIQATAANVIQGLGAREIKKLINSLGKDDTPEGEAARAALQGILACATATGQGADCGSAAMGASGSVALNYLINSVGDKHSKDLTPEEKENRLKLVNTILSGTVEALGGDSTAAYIAAKVEMENNYYGIVGSKILRSQAQPGKVLLTGGSEGCEAALGYCVVIDTRPEEDKYGIFDVNDWNTVVEINTEEDYANYSAQLPPRTKEDLARLGGEFIDGGLTQVFSGWIYSGLIISGFAEHPSRGKLSDVEKAGLLVSMFVETFMDPGPGRSGGRPHYNRPGSTTTGSTTTGGTTTGGTTTGGTTTGGTTTGGTTTGGTTTGGTTTGGTTTGSTTTGSITTGGTTTGSITTGGTTTGLRTIISPEMEQKILYGQRTVNNSGQPSNKLIGGHSGQISDASSQYAVEVIATHADGTTTVRFVTQFSDGNLSKLKTSTLFPTSWSDKNIIDSIQRIGESAPIAQRLSTGETLHRGIINGVEIDVIKKGNEVTAGYPLGGKPTPGFDPIK